MRPPPCGVHTFVVRLVTRLNAEVKALNVQFYKWQYQLVLDQLPDDPAGRPRERRGGKGCVHKGCVHKGCVHKGQSIKTCTACPGGLTGSSHLPWPPQQCHLQRRGRRERSASQGTTLSSTACTTVNSCHMSLAASATLPCNPCTLHGGRPKSGSNLLSLLPFLGWTTATQGTPKPKLKWTNDSKLSERLSVEQRSRCTSGFPVMLRDRAVT